MRFTSLKLFHFQPILKLIKPSKIDSLVDRSRSRRLLTHRLSSIRPLVPTSILLPRRRLDPRSGVPSTCNTHSRSSHINTPRRLLKFPKITCLSRLPLHSRLNCFDPFPLLANGR